jgi:hypothetical protein
VSTVAGSCEQPQPARGGSTVQPAAAAAPPVPHAALGRRGCVPLRCSPLWRLPCVAGLSLIDRFTYASLDFFEKVGIHSAAKMDQLVKIYRCFADPI